jgi:predicted phosphatase
MVVVLVEKSGLEINYMPVNRIDDVIVNAKKIVDILRENGLNRQSHGIDKITDLLKNLESMSESEIQEKLLSKPYKREIELLYSLASDIKGLKDMCPDNISYDEWRTHIYNLKESINKMKSLYLIKKK